MLMPMTRGLTGFVAVFVAVLTAGATLAPSVVAQGSRQRPQSSGGADADAQRGHGRLFAPQDLGMLEGPDREAWQRPDQIMDVLGIGDGSVVADLGAGGGWFTVRLARRVGPNGVVYAEDIQPQMIEAIERRVEREGLRNVETVLGSADNPTLPDERLDVVLMVDSFQEVEDRVTLLRHVRQSLKPGGRLGIVGFRTDGGGGPGPAVEDRVTPAQVRSAAEAAGLRFAAQDLSLPYQFLLVFTR